MKRIKLIATHILNGENRKAVCLLKKIREENDCLEYAEAFEKVMLIETAKKLNEDISGFYLDTEELSKSLFSQNPPDEISVINHMCRIAKGAASEDYNRAFAKAMQFIEKNLCNNQLSVGAAAEYAGVSGSTLVKLFKEKCRMSPGDFMSESRVKRSLKLLSDGASVAETALAAGFTSSESYIRAFKKYMKVTPGEWKRNKLFL